MERLRRSFVGHAGKGDRVKASQRDFDTEWENIADDMEKEAPRKYAGKVEG